MLNKIIISLLTEFYYSTHYRSSDSFTSISKLFYHFPQLSHISEVFEFSSIQTSTIFNQFLSTVFRSMMKSKTKRAVEQTTEANANHEQRINHNGFTNTPPLTQILPPIIVLMVLVMTLIQIHLVLDQQWLVIGSDIALAVDFALVCWLWYASTNLVPTDSVQLKHLEAIEKGEEFDHTNYTFYCHTCKTYTNSNCFHCKKCRRCVEFFDHHCKWLNNCIGAKNYFEFYGLLITTFILLALCICLSSLSLAQIDKNDKQGNSLVVVCSISTILIAAIPNCWLVYLISLHTYLIIVKKSTIELILESRARNQVKPFSEDSAQTNNNIFKIAFTRPSTHKDFVANRIVFPEKDEDLQHSNTETNNNLIISKEKEISESVSISNNRSLPPIRTKVNFNLHRQAKTCISYSQGARVIIREN